MTNPPNGPYLNAALICEKVIQEKDEVTSIIRIVDRVILTTTASFSPEKIPPTTLDLYAFLSFKSGSARGRHTIKWVTEAPSGIRSPEQLLPALFEGEDRGVNFIWLSILPGEKILGFMKHFPIKYASEDAGDSGSRSLGA